MQRRVHRLRRAYRCWESGSSRSTCNASRPPAGWTRRPTASQDSGAGTIAGGSVLAVHPGVAAWRAAACDRRARVQAGGARAAHSRVVHVGGVRVAAGVRAICVAPVRQTVRTSLTYVPRPGQLPDHVTGHGGGRRGSVGVGGGGAEPSTTSSAAAATA
eukprot:ctg_3592.g718